MWTRLSESLNRFWQSLQSGVDEDRTEKNRARFWAEVREGQVEADLAIRSPREHRAGKPISA